MNKLDPNTVLKWIEEFADETNKHLFNGDNSKPMAKFVVYITNKAYLEGLKYELDRIKKDFLIQ